MYFSVVFMLYLCYVVFVLCCICVMLYLCYVVSVLCCICVMLYLCYVVFVLCCILCCVVFVLCLSVYVTLQFFTNWNILAKTVLRKI